MRHSTLFKFIVLLIICVCTCPGSHAQIMHERQKPDQIGGKGHTKPQQTTKPRQKQRSSQSRGKKLRQKSSDKNGHKPKGRDSKPRIGGVKPSDGRFAYYANVVKLNGWLVGVGEPLTVEQVRAGESPYFKLSQMNAAGNWCFVEAFDYCGNASEYHGIEPYIYDFDSPDLFDAFESVSKWEFIADPSGVVVEERWLLADSSAVLSFHQIQIGDREILGLYTDKHGVPICTYDEEVDKMTDIVCLVHIIRDEYGFDVTIEEFGADSIPEKYKEAASRLLKKFDKKDP